jgi:HprK-related kinase A
LAWLEWAMNTCVYSFGYAELMLHAAAVARGDAGVLLIGRSGSGKSTLCAACVMNGWRLLSDEIALISPQDGLLSGMVRPIVLKNRSIEIIRERYPQAVCGPLMRQTAKGDVAHLRPPRESVRLMDERVPPVGVYFVEYRAGARLSRRSIGKGRAMIGVAGSSFNYGALGRVGFETLAGLVERCECQELVYGNLDEVLEFLEREHGAAGEEQTAAHDQGIR